MYFSFALLLNNSIRTNTHEHYFTTQMSNIYDSRNVRSKRALSFARPFSLENFFSPQDAFFSINDRRTLADPGALEIGAL